ncbi:MAG: ATP-binding protein [Desulfobacteraceae bacterium]
MQRYRAKLSGPLLDRIDLHLDALALPYRGLAAVHEEGCPCESLWWKMMKKSPPLSPRD